MDERLLRRALRLAARGRYRTSPNPMVGAVIVRDGSVVAEGYHRQVGGPHAEVEALRKAGEQARGATLYVTLEPCNHHGRTPPCSEALIAAGVRRVIACHRDPDPRTGGEGFARLQAADIEVKWGFLEEEAVRLNWRFLTATVQQRPAVSLKWAMTLDGKIATAAGHSQWISSPEGRRWGLRQREEHDAILVGIGTALADNPRLNRRLGLAVGPNIRVVLDRRLRHPPDARLFDIEGEVLIYTENENVDQRQPLEERGATVIYLPQVSPEKVLPDLHERGIRSLLVEGGAGVASAFLQAELFDRVGVDLAPLLVGGETAPGPLGGTGFVGLDEAPRLSDLRVERRGQDVILTGFRTPCLQDLFASVAP